MRIISGKFKGRKIFEPVDLKTRPLKDLTKESIFNIIKHSNLIKVDIENSNILDLFSGTGSFGLECISRGASKVTFFENYKSVIKILKKNIHNFGCEKKTNIIEKDIFNKKKFYFDEKFEIIFLDPPYKEKKITNIINRIYELDIIKKNGIIILHRHKREKDKFPNKFKPFIEKNYGISNPILEAE